MKGTEMTVIAAWPGTGKTTAGLLEGVIDLESSDYKWLDAKPNRDKEAAKGCLHVPNPSFPANYVDAVLAEHRRGKIVLTSMHAGVLDLIEQSTPVICVVPHREDRDLYLARYEQRGNPPAMIEHMRTHWDDYLTQASTRGCVVTIEPDQYLTDILTAQNYLAQE